MSGRNVPVVVIPRFTTFAGNQAFDMLQIPVAAYEQIVLNVWRGPYVPPGPSIGVAFQESNDLSNWTTCSGDTFADPGPANEAQFVMNLTKAWFRVRVNTGAAVTVTMWAAGFLILREK